MSDEPKRLGRGFCVACRRDVDVELVEYDDDGDTILAAKCGECGELFAAAAVVAEKGDDG